LIPLFLSQRSNAGLSTGMGLLDDLVSLFPRLNDTASTALRPEQKAKAASAERG
jgi:hypothetical protein